MTIQRALFRTMTAALLTTSLLHSTAMAQPPPPPPPPPSPSPALEPAPAAAPASVSSTGGGGAMLLGVDGELAIPTGKFSDGAGLGFGGLVRFEYNLMPKLNLTGRVGYIYFLGKDLGVASTKFHTIPFLAGAKYDLTDAIYAAAELGLFNNGSTVESNVNLGPFGGNQTSFSASETDFGLTLGVGIRLGDLDARAGLQFLDLGHAGDTMCLGLNVGYNFWRK